MTPGAHLQAAIELLGLIDESNRTKGQTSAAILKSYFKTRRYAGSRDRRAIRSLVFDILRDWERCLWLVHAADMPSQPRNLAIAYAAAQSESTFSGFGADRYSPPALAMEELAAVGKMQQALPNTPRHAALNVPEDLYALLEARYGDDTPALAASLNTRAPIMLRLNTPQADNESLATSLASQNLEARGAAFLPNAMQIEDANDVQTLACVQDGLAEVQDEASQLCAASVNPPPGGLVIDLCAGAGGKALAIASRHPKVRILACDISKKRLAELAKRAERAGARNITTVLLPADYPAQACPELQAIVGEAHWALVDAPCSSSGTWRRRPEVRFRYSAADIETFAALQSRLLAAASTLVRAGGKVTYASCSLLPQEGEQRMEAFLGETKGLEAVDYQSLLRSNVKKMPETLSNIKEWLLLSPDIHGCDGFFCATVRRI